jgi:hypothetical protein
VTTGDPDTATAGCSAIKLLCSSRSRSR